MQGLVILTTNERKNLGQNQILHPQKAWIQDDRRNQGDWRLASGDWKGKTLKSNCVNG